MDYQWIIIGGNPRGKKWRFSSLPPFGNHWEGKVKPCQKFNGIKKDTNSSGETCGFHNRKETTPKAPKENHVSTPLGRKQHQNHGFNPFIGNHTKGISNLEPRLQNPDLCTKKGTTNNATKGNQWFFAYGISTIFFWTMQMGCSILG